MRRSLLYILWNISLRGVAEHFYPGLFNKRVILDPILPFDSDECEIQRLKNTPRYTSVTTEFMGKRLELVDVDSYFAMCEELFVKSNYEFEACRKDPLIIDCGANIGLSVIYFKQLYPAARIIAFEADSNVFNALQKNVESFGFADVELHNKAVWSEETELEFYAEGSWGGRFKKSGDVEKIIQVKTSRLKTYLNQDIDFLKLDVEGAETEILKDCAESLSRVKNLFVEYHSHIGERQTLHELLAILQDAGFRYHVKEASCRKVPFIDRTTIGMDLQLDIFAFRM